MPPKSKRKPPVTTKGAYFLRSGTRVPSVTTIIGKFKEAEGLMHWAWKMGSEGKDYREARDEAASTGTLAHTLVEKWIRKETPTLTGPKASVMQARNAFNLFLKWAKQSKLRVTETEVPLVSEKYKFGGTLDAMLVQGELSLGDWKTSNHVYVDYLFQLAAYGLLWKENRPREPITGGYHLMRFAKDSPDFVHHFWGDLREAERGFILMRQLYDIKAQLSKRV